MAKSERKFQKNN